MPPHALPEQVEKLLAADAASRRPGPGAPGSGAPGPGAPGAGAPGSVTVSGAPASVTVRETHISWVFLVGDRAFKLKKPLVLPFLDYGTPARRRELCGEEVRLNRRLAPDLYLGVRGLAAGADGLELTDAEDPEALDFLVEMHRYDEQQTLRATLDRGETTRAELAGIGALLAAFHASCEPVGPRADGAQAAQAAIGENLSELLALTELQSERERVLTLWRFASAFISAHRVTFEQRTALGFVRDCHGDLRAEHVILGDPAIVVDCVEFDPGLRALDIADDLAFLLMDLEALGAPHCAAEVLDGYRAAGADPGPDALVRFYSAHRALVRAKVLLVRAGQLPDGSGTRSHELALAREHIALAERLSWRARLPLVLVVCGVPASGKSHLARALAQTTELPHLSTDVTRKRLAGIEELEHAVGEHYGAEFNRATYEELGARAVRAVAAHGGAILDGTFRHASDREAFASAFAAAAPIVFIECRAPSEVLRERALQRDRTGRGPSDATVDVVMHERSSWEPLDEAPPGSHLIVRSDRRVEEVVGDVVAELDERLGVR